jgi:hypothetical protein
VPAAARANYNTAKQITDSGPPGHPACDIGTPIGGIHMLWILAVLMGGLGFGYVTIRRKRKAEQKGS